MYLNCSRNRITELVFTGNESLSFLRFVLFCFFGEYRMEMNRIVLVPYHVFPYHVFWNSHVSCLLFILFYVIHDGYLQREPGFGRAMKIHIQGGD